MNDPALDQGRPPRLSVIIPVYNDPKMLVRTLRAIAASDYPDFECIVVDDGSKKPLDDVVAPFGARLIRVADGPRGPAHARNAGAAVAGGAILVFVDADVLIAPTTLRKFAEDFDRDAGVAAVFGSYDDEPATPDFISQFKNLFHHFVHQQANEEAVTFWSGCGAIRRDLFQSVGGFDHRLYARPSIEDIELGYRVHAAGHRILLDKAIQVKHLKRWTLRTMIRTDVFDRGVPWTLLILEHKRLPNDLNLRVTQRLSALLAYSMLLYVALVAFFHQTLLLPIIAALFLMFTNASDWTKKMPGVGLLGPKSEFISYVLLVALAAFAWFVGMTGVLPPLGLLLLGLVGGRWLSASGLARSRFFFPVVLGAFVISVVALLSTFTAAVAAPLVVCLLFIVLLNYRLGAFFVRKRGLLFAATALPMLVFYYSYALLSLVLGTLQFLFRNQEGRDLPKAAPDRLS